jgi:hypothetical protein
MLRDAERVMDHLVAVDEDRHLVLLAERDRRFVADAHRPVFGDEALVREREPGAPRIEAVAAVVQPAEFVQCQRHVAIPVKTQSTPARRAGQPTDGCALTASN